MKSEHEFRLVPAGLFKATCLQLMEEVSQKPLTIIMTKRGKPVAQMSASPRDLKIVPASVEMVAGHEILASAEAAEAENGGKKKDREKKRKDKKKHK